MVGVDGSIQKATNHVPMTVSKHRNFAHLEAGFQCRFNPLSLLFHPRFLNEKGSSTEADEPLNFGHCGGRAPILRQLSIVRFRVWLAFKQTSPAVTTISNCLLSMMINGANWSVHIRVNDSCKYFLLLHELR